MKAGHLEGPAVTSMREMDLDQVLVLEEMCFSNPWPREVFLYDLRSTDSCSLVLRMGDEVAGYIVGWFVLAELHILNIAVHPQKRRRGLAKILLGELLTRARGRGCRRATLELRASNETASGLYQKHGFRPVATRKDYYQRPVEDAVVMLKDLNDEPEQGPADQEVPDGVVSQG
jgi:ribosomal-protein-alanine N-acetyltransferase